MPYFGITTLAEQLKEKPRTMSRKTMLDNMRRTIAERGWTQ